MVMPMGTRSVTGFGDGARDGEVFVRHRLVEADVHQRLHVGDGAVDIFGQAARRNHAAGDHVHQDELIARGIAVGQRDHANAGGDGGLKRGNDVVILLLDADDALARAHQLHGHLHAAQEGLGVVVQELLVLMQERLALGGVGDEDGDLGLEA